MADSGSPSPREAGARSRIDALSAPDIAARLRRADAAGSAAEERSGPSGAEPRPAAVLIPMIRTEDRWRLLYIRRSEHDGDRHSGEVAFPGGRCERGDADRAGTALRETQEEIGLDPRCVEVLGELRPFRTVSNFLVTPVVGLLPWPVDLFPDPAEVARVFSIPLSWLNDPRKRRVRPWPAPDHPQVRRVVFFDEFDGERLWGVSARITLDFLCCLNGSGPDFGG